VLKRDVKLLQLTNHPKEHPKRDLEQDVYSTLVGTTRHRRLVCHCRLWDWV